MQQQDNACAKGMGKAHAAAGHSASVNEQPDIGKQYQEVVEEKKGGCFDTLPQYIHC
jgi:hypothetical protein